MDGIAAAVDGGLQNDIAAQIGLRRRRRSYPHRLIGQGRVQGAGIRIRVHGYGANTHFLAGADDANGDFAAISNQYLA